jgi:hypothetical protein
MAYKTETIHQHGKKYLIEWERDHAHGAPWEEDGHGIVSDWETRPKKPGEIILSEGRWGKKRFYDLQASIKLAKAEGWNTSPYEWPTKGAQAHAAAMADYEYLRRWCNDQWHYCGIIVTLADEEGEPTDITASLWGIEDDGYCSDGYHATVIQDLIGECEQQENACTYAGATVGI